jgi:hypothetical protein
MDGPVEQKSELTLAGRLLHIDTLRDFEACKAQLEAFWMLTDDDHELVITEAWAALHAMTFSWEWGVDYLLSKQAQMNYGEWMCDASVLPEWWQGTYSDQIRRRAVLWARAYINDPESPSRKVDDDSEEGLPVTPTVAIQDDSGDGLSTPKEGEIDKETNTTEG